MDWWDKRRDEVHPLLNHLQGNGYSVRFRAFKWHISAEGDVMCLNARYLLDLPRESGGNFGLSRLEWRYRAVFIGRYFLGREQEKMPKRKRKVNVGPYYPGHRVIASGVTMSEMLFQDTEDLSLEIGQYVKPYTRLIRVNVKQNGKHLGTFQMHRRPS